MKRMKPATEQEARDVEPEPLHCRAEEQRRDEHLRHAPQLVARDEGPGNFLALEQGVAETEDGRAGQDDAQVERQVARLRTILRPSHAAAPVVETQQQRQREQQHVHDHFRRSRGRHRR
jgi:hypothetical protein